MTTAEACAFRMPFGKHKGKTLREIAIDDLDGARYLDWCVGLKNLHAETRNALRIFLALPWVTKLVEEEIESNEYDEPNENSGEPPHWWENK